MIQLLEWFFLLKVYLEPVAFIILMLIHYFNTVLVSSFLHTVRLATKLSHFNF